MSTLLVDELESPTGTLSLASGASLAGVGSESKLLQIRYFRTNVRASYGSTAEMTPTRLYITPTSASSILRMEWMVNGEVGHDGTMRVYKNGSVVTETGYTGYNVSYGTASYSGVSFFYYDAANDNSSTPHCLYIQFYIPAGSTSEQYFSLAPETQTFYLNRTVANAGSNNYENGITTGIISEWSE